MASPSPPYIYIVVAPLVHPPRQDHAHVLQYTVPIHTLLIAFQSLPLASSLTQCSHSPSQSRSTSSIAQLSKLSSSSLAHPACPRARRVSLSALTEHPPLWHAQPHIRLIVRSSLLHPSDRQDRFLSPRLRLIGHDTPSAHPPGHMPPSLPSILPSSASALTSLIRQLQPTSRASSHTPPREVLPSALLPLLPSHPHPWAVATALTSFSTLRLPAVVWLASRCVPLRLRANPPLSVNCRISVRASPFSPSARRLRQPRPRSVDALTSCLPRGSPVGTAQTRPLRGRLPCHIHVSMPLMAL
ncbi:hypothetical protein PYCCODRAFT_485108 [Trametes coccinea BRFM310]|uniref:Uncharacterized protein n=1 Tax=Trametes coccinea (strain BRFM310) TaxID=1353009 RepID=A0A1Y2ILS1_TRAC3|nr:hypothetical protein PYCCODRAFT_485108 [Trametes coccinea BRFM310]